MPLPIVYSLKAMAISAVAALALGFGAGYWFGSLTYKAQIAALKADIQEAKREVAEAKLEHAAKIAEATNAATSKIIVRREEVIKKSADAEKVIATDNTPSLHDPRCAWPDAVLQAVNEARMPEDRGGREGRNGK